MHTEATNKTTLINEKFNSNNEINRIKETKINSIFTKIISKSTPNVFTAVESRRKTETLEV
jgi:hypothetical protein